MIAPELVLMYHRINTLRPDPWTACVSPQHFAEHLEVIARLPVRTVITFDDGYADNFENARPLLERHDREAIIFVTSGAVGSPFEMWWDELDRRYLKDTAPGWDWDDAEPDPGAKQYREAFQRAREGDVRIFPERPWARPERRMMTRAEVAELAAGGLITIGAHTVTHPVLSALSVARQREEIVQCKADLERIVDRSIELFAYPNGFKTDYTAETMHIVKEAGYTRAYAAWEAPLDAPLDAYQIPRVMVRDWDGDRFAAVLRAKLPA